MEDLPPPPPGVTLRAPTDYAGRREDMYSAVKAATMNMFPQEYGGIRMELEDVDYTGEVDDSPDNEKKKILTGGDLTRKLTGNLVLRDATSRDILDTKRMTLMQVPHLTRRGTAIMGGSDYTTMSMDRLLPGIFTRRKKNEQLETHVNALMGSGPSLRVSMDPKSSIYYLEKQDSRWKLYPILRALGYGDGDLKDKWGDHVLAANQEKSNDRAFESAYQKLVKNPDINLPQEKKVEQIRAVLDGIRLHRRVVTRTIPNLLDSTKSAAWKQAGDKLDKAPFDPDFKYNQMRETINMILGHHGPLIAGSRNWPQHWLNEDGNGWLHWYEGYCIGKRSKDDNRQMTRWKALKARLGASFKKTRSKRLAVVLQNWAIDPAKLLDPTEAVAFRKELEQFKADHFSTHFSQDKSASELSTVDVRMLAHFLNQEFGTSFDILKARDELEQEVQEFSDAHNFDMDRFIADHDLADEAPTKSANAHPPLSPISLPGLAPAAPAKAAPQAFDLANHPAYPQYLSYLRQQENGEAEAKGLRYRDPAKGWMWRPSMDPSGKFWTMGYGTKLYPPTAKPQPGLAYFPKGVAPANFRMSDSQVEANLHKTVQSSWGKARAAYETTYGPGTFATLHPGLQLALSDGPFTGVETPKQYAAANAGDWDTLKKETLSYFTDPKTGQKMPLAKRQTALNSYIDWALQQQALAKPQPAVTK